MLAVAAGMGLTRPSPGATDRTARGPTGLDRAIRTKLKWTYVAPKPTDFFAEAISGCQRLPNGNTLICDGTSGVLFEVTPSGEKVWEYVCPVSGEGPMNQGDSIPLDHRRHAMNAIFKVLRYEPSYPGLAGKDLSPKGRLTGSSASRANRRRDAGTGRDGAPRDRRDRRDARDDGQQPRGRRD